MSSTSTPPPVPKLLNGWAQAVNRRRALEELAAAVAWLGLFAILAVGLYRLPSLLAWLDLPVPAWASEDGQRAKWLMIGWSVLALAVVAIAGRRFVRRRTRPFGLARDLDREHGTHDLLATAWSLETGAVTADAGLTEVVVARARATAAGIRKPVAPWAAPTRALASLGLMAAVVGLVPLQPPIADLAGTANAADGKPAAPPLDDETVAKLERTADSLAQLERRPALRESTKRALADARQNLEALRKDPGKSLGALSKAEQALREAAREAQREGMFDPEALKKLDAETLAREMVQAIERGDTDTAAAMA